MFPEQVHKSFYFGALILLAISLPLSEFTLSVAQITLVVNWFLEGKFRQKWELTKQRPSLWFIVCFYLVYLLWMVNTSDFVYGFHDLKIKLPMFTLPLVIGTSEFMNERKLKIILNLYLGAVLAASLISSYFIFGFDGIAYHNIEQVSPFVWHIRWSLMVVISIFIAFWLIERAKTRVGWLYILLVLWLIFYLFIFQVLTGIFVFILTSAILLIWLAFKSKQLMIKWFVILILLTIILVTTSYVTNSYTRFHTFDKVDLSKLEKITSKGNPYWHDLNRKFVENGHYIYLYICEPELRESWNLRSKLSYDGNTLNGEKLKYCLARYLTSKGFRKDSEGVDHLTNREIKFIEMGKTNFIDTVKYGLYPKIYVVWWELYNYRNGANPTGYSISQRIEFLKTGFHIIQKNLWFGVGTGDVPDAFDKQYEIDKSSLALNNRFRTHNQLVTFMVTFGVIGFVLILISILAPPFFEKKYSSYLFLVIFIIGILSFLNEDTLETHQGISFFAFFYTLFLFYKKDESA